jgi:hypothetical protein
MRRKKDNDAHFKRNGKILYDKENLEKIKRFANAPMGYINERIELNNKVSESYHKFYESIVLAGFTGFFAILLSHYIISLVDTLEIPSIIPLVVTYIDFKSLAAIVILLTGTIIAIKIRITHLILRWIGLLKDMLDSEIQIYYLSKMKEYRSEIEKNRK